MAFLNRYSLGIGDRFARQGSYQLEALIEAAQNNVHVTPVWNKSFREHKTVGSLPESVREEAARAVHSRNWTASYMVDADHVTLSSVDDFLSSSDFFTIDVAEQINTPLQGSTLDHFRASFRPFLGKHEVPGMEPFEITEELLVAMGDKFFHAAEKANDVYRKISNYKNGYPIAIEVSMDEVERAQTPVELYFILKLLAHFKVPLSTIAPKFTGRFNKGVDYEGDLDRFSEEFEKDLLVIDYAVERFGLAGDLKLSIHTGSDKFSLYPVINRLISKHNTGIHLKTAGTTWLEELIGLSQAGGSGLQIVKKIYQEALHRYDELTGPYQTVLNIDRKMLPTFEEVDEWCDEKMARTLRHDQADPWYNSHLRQLFHTAYKIAAEKGKLFTEELEKNEAIIGKNVKENILERHVKPLFYSS